MIRVQVPATSANLGVGYDCMGLALSEYATVCFDECDQKLVVEGCLPQYCNEDNMIYTSFKEACKYMKKEVPNIKIMVDTKVPYARGMGSSATCIVAGIIGASAFFKDAMTMDEIFNLATKIEGHPDNISPAIFGSLCVSFMDEGKAYHIKYPVCDDLLCVMLIPDYEVKTKEAREVLPKTMSYEDAIYQMGRCVLLTKALETGNEFLIKKASVDRMQEPYRKKLIKEYDDAKAICEAHHMITMLISGSGSTMMAFTKNKADAIKLCEEVMKKYPTWDTRILHVDKDGAKVG